MHRVTLSLMKTALWVRSILLCAAVVFSASEVQASDPVGVYCVIEKVVFEPNEAKPNRIQVWGAFSLSDGKSGDGYLPPQYGYMYFTIAPVQERAAFAEWTDLKKVAGTGDLIAFGGRYAANGRIRKATDKADTPDAYPIAVGITRLRSLVTAPYNGSLAETAARMRDILRAKLESGKAGSRK